MTQLAEQPLELLPKDTFPVVELDPTIHKFDTHLDEAEIITASHETALDKSDVEVDSFKQTVEDVLRGYTEIQRSLRDKAVEFHELTKEVAALRVTYTHQLAELATVMHDINAAINNVLKREVSASLYHEQDAEEQERTAAKVRLLRSEPSNPDEANEKMMVFEEMGGMEPDKLPDGRYKNDFNAEEERILREVDEWRARVKAYQVLKVRIEDYGLAESRRELDKLYTRQLEIADEAYALKVRLARYMLPIRVIAEDQFQEIEAHATAQLAGSTALTGVQLTVETGGRDGD